MKIHVLVGEGIECENESLRFFGTLEFAARRVRIQDLLQKKRNDIAPGDWIFIPGGFSFADHFGSGKLLAYELKQAGLFADCAARGVHLMGICNGFQVLTEAALFGRGVSLRPNQNSMGFVNRWIRLRGAGFAAGGEYQLPVRHGEGCLVRGAAAWDAGVAPFLIYDDPHFDNGSVDRVAGLAARRGNAVAVGLMPHPEIAARPTDSPDSVPPENAAPGRAGDGITLMKAVFKWAHES